ncbi:MAG: hypothetical protein R3E13_00565 [Alphaproteobacteria bacterium]
MPFDEQIKRLEERGDCYALTDFALEQPESLPLAIEALGRMGGDEAAG